jgi:hypothetical protein
MSRTGRTLVALAGAALVLVIATWFDKTIMSDALRHAQATFNASGLAAMTAFGSLLVAGSVLVVGTLAWRAASGVVGVVYIVVGGFFVALPWLARSLATQVNDVPAVLPQPLAQALWRINDTGVGPLNAVGTIGAAMLIAGVAALLQWWRGRAVAEGRPEAVVPTADPMLP